MIDWICTNWTYILGAYLAGVALCIMFIFPMIAKIDQIKDTNEFRKRHLKDPLAQKYVSD